MSHRDSFFELIVLEGRLTGVHYYGVELERTPLLERLERPVPRPQRWVRVPLVQLLLEERSVMAGEPPGELVLVFDLDQVHPVTTGDYGRLLIRRAVEIVEPSAS